MTTCLRKKWNWLKEIPKNEYKTIPEYNNTKQIQFLKNKNKNFL